MASKFRQVSAVQGGDRTVPEASATVREVQLRGHADPSSLARHAAGGIHAVAENVADLDGMVGNVKT